MANPANVTPNAKQEKMVSAWLFTCMSMTTNDAALNARKAVPTV
jgi:hypothetical protein